MNKHGGKQSLDPALLQMLPGSSIIKQFGQETGHYSWIFFFFGHFLLEFYGFFCFPFCIFFLPQLYHVSYIETTLKPRIPQVFCHRVCLLIQSASMDPFFAHYQDQD